MFRKWIAVAFAGAALVMAGAPASAQEASAFTNKTAVSSAHMSPSGKEIAFISRTGDKQQLSVINLDTRKRRTLQEVTDTETYSLDWVRWKGDGRLVVGATVEKVVEGRARTGSRLRKKSDFNYQVSRVFAMNADGGGVAELFQGRRSQLAANGVGSTDLLDILSGDPAHVLISAYDHAGFGAWKADIATGKVERVADGEWTSFAYATDGVGYPVLRLDGTMETIRVLRRASGSQKWIEVGAMRRNLISGAADFNVVGPGPGAGQVYVLARQGGDRAALHLYDSATGDFGPALMSGVDGDAAGPVLHPVRRDVLATCEFAARLVCKSGDSRLQQYLGALDQFFGGKATVGILSMSEDTNRWLLHVNIPTEGSGLYVFDRAAVHVEQLTTDYPDLLGGLAPTEVVPYTARDGTKLWAYVTARPGAGPRPTVLMPHGGPEARDYYGFDAMAQFLAARGYVVVQPNFRGSGGFGDAFADAGRGEWGRRMQHDVTDALKHMVDTGQSDPKRVCIVGASYGGYAALAGATLTPELYRCAVSIAGVSDLEEILRSEKNENGMYSNVYHYWRQSIGDPGKDRAAILANSPRRLVDKVVAPILLIHGKEDETVPVRQSVIMNDALRAAGKKTRLVTFETADHYWDNWERKDLLTMFEETAAFLKQNLD